MLVPRTEPAQRIATLFKRRITTAWNDKEVKAYKQLFLSGCFKELNDLELIERYYAYERRKGEKGVHRRDLGTFLNNYAGELDRAREWDALHRTVQYKHREVVEPISDEEWEKIAEAARRELKRFQEQYERRYEIDRTA